MFISHIKEKLNSAKVFDLLTHPDQRLTQKSVDVDFDRETAEELDQLITDLIATMRKEKGAGLAAIQVGIPKRIFVYDDSDKSDNPRVLINPRIVSASKELIESEEGCLSFPELYAPVKRSKTVTVEGYDSNGEKITVEATDFLARVLQHEIDHLDGINFVTRLGEAERKLALREYFDLKK